MMTQHKLRQRRAASPQILTEVPSPSGLANFTAVPHGKATRSCRLAWQGLRAAPEAPALVGPQRRLRVSNSSSVRGQSDRRSRERLRSASSLPPVWQWNTVVCFVVCVTDPLDRLATPWARLSIASMHRHVFTKGCHLFRKGGFRFLAQPFDPELKRYLRVAW